MEKWSERLSTLDALFLELEDRTTHMHVGAVAEFEGKPPPYRDLLALIDARLDQTGIAQDPEVLGDRGLAQLELANELADRALSGAQQIEDPAAVRLREDVEHGHLAIEYSRSGI